MPTVYTHVMRIPRYRLVPCAIIEVIHPPKPDAAEAKADDQSPGDDCRCKDKDEYHGEEDPSTVQRGSGL